MCHGFAMVSLERIFLTGLKNLFERIKEFCLERYRKTTCLVLAVLEIWVSLFIERGSRSLKPNKNNDFEVVYWERFFLIKLKNFFEQIQEFFWGQLRWRLAPGRGYNLHRTCLLYVAMRLSPKTIWNIMRLLTFKGKNFFEQLKNFSDGFCYDEPKIFFDQIQYFFWRVTRSQWVLRDDTISHLGGWLRFD